MSLFQTAALFTDIHFGEHLDAETHNRDCLEFVHWFCDQVYDSGADTVIFMGDWFHNQVRTEHRTAHYSRIALETLNDLKMPIYWILGNHELYYKHNRDIHSVQLLPHFENIRLLDQITKIDDVIFAPWLVGNEKDELVALQGKYVFSHLALPLFLMNQVIEMRDDGKGIVMDDFQNCEAVYSGHFHKRQCKINKHGIPVNYIGNCFGHNFNDVNDPDRGMAILRWGETLPEYRAWPDAPTYHRYLMSDFLDMLEEGSLPGERSIIELNDDLNLSDEAIDNIKGAIDNRGVRIIQTHDTIMESTVNETEYANLDQMVETELRNLNYDGKYEADLMVNLYRSVE